MTLSESHTVLLIQHKASAEAVRIILTGHLTHLECYLVTALATPRISLVQPILWQCLSSDVCDLFIKILKMPLK